LCQTLFGRTGLQGEGDEALHGGIQAQAGQPGELLERAIQVSIEA